MKFDLSTTFCCTSYIFTAYYMRTGQTGRQTKPIDTNELSNPIPFMVQEYKNLMLFNYFINSF